MICQDEGRHRLDDGYGAGQDAGIVAALALERGRFALVGDGVLGGNDCRGRLEGDAENDVLAVGDAALYSAGTVGGGADFSVAHFERVVVFLAGE